MITIRLFRILAYLGISLTMTSCIGDDILFDTVEPVLRITAAVDTIAVSTDYQFTASYFNNIGREDKSAEIVWSSSDADIISITTLGLATALKRGNVTITAQVLTNNNLGLSASFDVTAGENTSEQLNFKSGEIKTTSSYELKGAFILEKMNNGELILSFGDDYKASTALPGLYVYLSNNKNSISGALEIGAVKVFEGEHSYNLGQNILITDYAFVLYYCKPFNVKVGEGEIK